MFDLRTVMILEQRAEKRE